MLATLWVKTTYLCVMSDDEVVARVDLYLEIIISSGYLKQRYEATQTVERPTLAEAYALVTEEAGALVVGDNFIESDTSPRRVLRLMQGVLNNLNSHLCESGQSGV